MVNPLYSFGLAQFIKIISLSNYKFRNYNNFTARNYLHLSICFVFKGWKVLCSIMFKQSLLKQWRGLTKRAPDAEDSAHISSSFLHLSLFLAGRLRRPRPSAGNAIR